LAFFGRLHLPGDVPVIFRKFLKILAVGNRLPPLAARSVGNYRSATSMDFLCLADPYNSNGVNGFPNNGRGSPRAPNNAGAHHSKNMFRHPKGD
jgi:hypothetical protein